MNVFNLPEDIIRNSEAKAERIIFHRYSAPMHTFNGNSILSKNAISLVISGEKTMHFAEKVVHIKDDEFHFLSTGNCLVSMKLANNVTFKSILLFFDDAVLTNFYLKYSQQIARITDNQQIASEPYLAFKKDAFILNFISSLDLMLQTTPRISTEMKLVKFEELMLYLLEKYPEKIVSFQ
jgi:hypothetical protein